MEGTEPTFERVFTPGRFNTIVNLRECWRQRPVTYGTRYYIPRVDHHAATVAWINGERWTQVANIICANHQNLKERTRAGIVAAYVSQMFEYRLPWVLGGVAVAARELGRPDELCNFLEVVTPYVRYGVNTTEAVTISKLCGAERAVVLVVAQKFLEEETEYRDLKTWVQHCSLNKLREWLPEEPEMLLRDLYTTLHSTRERDWTLRREKRVVTELAGWRNYGWPEVAEALQSSTPVEFSLRLELENVYDPFAVAVDASWRNRRVQIGYVPALYSEEISELLDWGRDIGVNIRVTRSKTPRRMVLHLLDVE